jgi:hypothetical protein
MANLYQLTDDLVALDALLQEAGGDVTDASQGAAIESWSQEFQWKLSDKIDAYAGLIRSWESDIKACAEERKRLAERERFIANRIDRLKALAKFAMQKLDTRKLEGKLFSISIAKNGGVVPMELIEKDVDKLPSCFVKTIKEIDMSAIRDGLEACNPLAENIARFGERGESVRVK